MSAGRTPRRVRVAAVLVVGLLALVGIEVAWRVTELIVRGVPVTTLLPEHRDTQFPFSPFLVFGPRIRHQILDRELPEQAYFDEAGFRTNEPVGPKPPGEFRVIALGGSTTENYRNESGLHWPLVVECRLREAGRPHVRVLNTGMSAYSTAHSLIRLQLDLLDYEPDMVLVMHAINDLNVTYRAFAAGLSVEGHYRAKYVNPHFTNEVADDDVVLLRSWRALERRLRPAPPVSDPVVGYDLEPGRGYFERNLRAIAGSIADRGAEAVFLTMPLNAEHVDAHRTAPENAGLVYLPTREALVADMDAYNRTILDVAAAVPRTGSVDMASILPDDESLYLDIVHYTTEGVVEFGYLLAGELVGRIPEPTEPYALSDAAVRRCDW